ncbi:DUF6758 family protein [Nocardioides zeae]
MCRYAGAGPGRRGRPRRTRRARADRAADRAPVDRLDERRRRALRPLGGGGEAHGRWLWLVLRPASAILLLRDDWILQDLSGVGPPLVELPFGGDRPVW